jgi:hypothetical protein
VPDNIGPKTSDGQQRPEKKAARITEGTGPGSSGDGDKGSGSARRGKKTGAEGTLRAERGAVGAGTGKGEVQTQWATSDTEDV